jgi:hypothetical protein
MLSHSIASDGQPCMYIRTIDIAHPALPSSSAEELIEDEVQNARSSKQWRVLKVIHGYGSQAGRSVLKEVVLNWAYRNRSRLLGLIPGEEYDIHHATTLEMRKICGQIHDPDLGAQNPGITLIWIQ